MYYCVISQWCDVQHDGVYYCVISLWCDVQHESVYYCVSALWCDVPYMRMCIIVLLPISRSSDCRSTDERGGRGQQGPGRINVNRVQTISRDVRVSVCFRSSHGMGLGMGIIVTAGLDF